MKKRNPSVIDLSPYKDIFDGVLVIPVKGRPPILVFKRFGGPFYCSAPGRLPYDYKVFLNNRLYDRDQSKKVIKGLSDLNEGIPTYLQYFPEDYKEFLISDIQNNHFIKHPYYKYLRPVLLKVGLVTKQKGKNNKPRTDVTEKRMTLLEKELLKRMNKGESTKRLLLARLLNIPPTTLNEYLKEILNPEKRRIRFVYLLKRDAVINNKDIQKIDFYKAWKLYVNEHNLDRNKFYGTRNDMFLAIKQVIHYLFRLNHNSSRPIVPIKTTTE